MKYFTSNWHSGDLEDEVADAVREDYWKHVALSLPKLVPEVQLLAENINLHDGLIREIALDPELTTLVLRLRCGDLQVGYFDLDLYYLKVLSTPSEKVSLAHLQADLGSALHPAKIDIH